MHAELFRKSVQANDIVKYADREGQELKYMAEFMQDIAVAPKEAVERILIHLKETFNLDNITIFAGDDLKAEFSLGKKLVNHQNANYAKSNEFKKLLSGKNYFTNSFIESTLETKSSFRQEMELSGIKSTAQCILGTSENIKALITFNHTKISQLWAEYEINCIAMFASALNLLYNKNPQKIIF